MVPISVVLIAFLFGLAFGIGIGLIVGSIVKGNRQWRVEHEADAYYHCFYALWMSEDERKDKKE